MLYIERKSFWLQKFRMKLFLIWSWKNFLKMKRRLANPYLRKIIWTVDFQLKHLLKISNIMNQPLFDITLLSPLYDTRLLDLLLQLGHITISGTTIRFLLLNNNLIFTSWVIKNFWSINEIFFKVIEFSVKFSSSIILKALLTHFNNDKIL